MLFHSSIRKEMARSFGATLVVLTTVVITMLLIRTLGLASRGSVDPTEVMLVLAYTVLGHAPTILTLSLFISIVSTLTRMYRDSEMAIWFASGRGLGSFVKPVARFVWPILLAIALLALFGWPWAHQQSQVIRDRFDQRGDLERVAPGEFQESSGGRRVFFVDKDAIAGKTAGEVFIAATERDREVVTSARSAAIENQGDDRFLVLSNGQRLERSLTTQSSKLSEFRQYGVLVTEKARAIAHDLEPRALSTRALLVGGTPPLLGELSWRLGLALAAANLVLIALVVSAVNPRVGRNGNLVFAFLTFALYYNLINLGSSRIAQATSAFWPFMLALHGGVLLFTLAWLAKRHWNWAFSSLWRRNASSAASTSSAA